MSDISHHHILAYLREHQQDMTHLLTQLVQLESPTHHKPSLDRLAAFLADQLRAVGADVEVLSQPQSGNHVLACWGQGDGGALMLCHMDTVWDVGTLIQRPVRIEDGRLCGPGAEDMKGGIVIGLWGVRALRALGLWPRHRITMLLNSDEETGSETSRALIETEALRHQVVFVLEPPEAPNGAYKTQRKGVGRYRLQVTGRAAHAGADHQKGINAIEELAHHIVAIQGFTDYAAGTTFNVGRVGGGARSNVVPEDAWAEVDVRIARAEEAALVQTRMAGLEPHLPGATLDVTGGLNRPPMVRSAEIAALYHRAQSIAHELGIALSEASTGGGSDGNFTAALGVPTLDGMGVVGDGGHAAHEYAVLASMPERAAILAAMLRSL